MKQLLKICLLTVLLIGCKKSTDMAIKPLPKNYQTAFVRIQAVDNDQATTTSQVVFITIEK